MRELIGRGPHESGADVAVYVEQLSIGGYRPNYRVICVVTVDGEPFESIACSGETWSERWRAERRAQWIVETNAARVRDYSKGFI